MAISGVNPSRALLLRPAAMVKGAVNSCVRFASGCEKGEGENRCPKVLTKFPCGKPDIQAPPKKKPKMVQSVSMWLNPFCDPDDTTCPFNPRFDDIYYVESDKAKRKYWQTWVACPPIQIKPKKICCFAKAKPAPIKRRKPSAKPSTACPQPCPDKTEEDCPRLARRCHRDGRRPPSCKRERGPLPCVKPRTPYPSFSECQRLRPGALPLKECTCLVKPMLCEVWAEFRRRAICKKNN
ncbi:uncharacterized protein [Drosophila suzukii]|uniref:Uncharacterized protein n=1 Tax=Drosophila suzukii TaxID=28584 RepID=A0AB39ZW25_DROSZ|nr:uncharacterized protein LOC108020641 [Drosophila suzukii]